MSAIMDELKRQELEELEAQKAAYPGFGCALHFAMGMALFALIPSWPPIAIVIVAAWVIAARWKRSRYLARLDAEYAAREAEWAAYVERKEAEASERSARDRREKIARLSRIYDAETVDRIMRREIAKGDPRAVLVAMFGDPSSEREHALKTKTKVVMKWEWSGVTATLEEGAVVSWVRDAPR